jgi:hypothetical protein
MPIETSQTMGVVQVIAISLQFPLRITPQTLEGSDSVQRGQGEVTAL